MWLRQKTLASVQKWYGRVVDYDGYYANQCVDWIKQFAADIWLVVTTSGNANDFIRLGLWSDWRRLNIGEVPSTGDVVIFPIGKYGHIAIFDDLENWGFFVWEQNRDGRAFRYNDVSNKWSPVGTGFYKLTGNEVFFTPVLVTKKSTNIRMRSWYKWDDRKYPILNQGNTWECVGFAILNCLMRMRDWVDYDKIAKELIEEKGNELTIRIGAKWFVDKGYIKWVRPASYIEAFLKRQPLITQFYNVNWKETGRTHLLTYGGRDVVGSHWCCVTNKIQKTDTLELGKVVNQYWSSWWDDWYFYFTDEQAKHLSPYYTLII